MLLACSNIEDYDKPFFQISKNVLLLESHEQLCEINIETNIEWDINYSEMLPDWICVEKMTDKLLNVSVKGNNSHDIRKCKIGFVEPIDTCFILVTQEAKAHLAFIGNKNNVLSAKDNSLEVEIENNILFDVMILDGGDDWICEKSSVFPSYGFDGKLLFQVETNNSNISRNARIVILNEEYNLSDTISVVQQGDDAILDRYADGFYLSVNQSFGSKTNLVVMGDGFTNNDLRKNGYYEQSISRAIEYFFSIEPYKSYREYFNVYMVVAESEEEGVGKKNFLGEGSIKNKFGTAYGSGTEIVCNDDLIFEYARKVKELPEDGPITVLVVLNSDKYAGTAYLYPDGNSIALCPMSTAESPNDFEGIVHHEAGGHAFGFLLDEYVYNQKEMPESRKREIQEWQKMGYQMNLDFTDDLDEILWKDFIGIDKYAPVGAYEGGYEYQFGVWRSEENSCMNNNIPYYNVQSRWSIVKRIMQLSDIEYSVEDFIKNDNPIYPTDGRALNTWDKFIPLGNPIWVVK